MDVKVENCQFFVLGDGPHPLYDEPNESSWIRCKTCGHDKYVHMHIGYGGCLYGEGCECAEYAHVNREVNS